LQSISVKYFIFSTPTHNIAATPAIAPASNKNGSTVLFAPFGDVLLFTAPEALPKTLPEVLEVDIEMLASTVVDVTPDVVTEASTVAGPVPV
jgi:hypothetical protein